jgi:predicted metal-dependent hydrolase
MTRQTVQFGKRTIPFTIHYADRKSLGLQVHPDCSVHAIAPQNSKEADIIKKVRQKAGWILKQQEHFISFLPLTSPRKYVNGETHLYLGRQYRLKKIQADGNQVKIYRGFIEVHTKSLTNEWVELILQDWYKAKAKDIFASLLTEIVEGTSRFQNRRLSLHTKAMPTRWGSCSPSGRITLNSELVKAPKACIEYVIIHELCHLIYPNHNKKFFRLLSSLMPDWEKWKGRLERSMT